MSYETAGWAWRIDGISPNERLTLLAICNYTDSEHTCYPSYERIAEMTCVSRRTAIRTVKKLVEMGFIEIITQGGQGGRGTTATNRYRVTFKENSRGDNDDIGGDKMSPQNTVRGDTGDTTGVTMVTLRGDTGDTPIVREQLDEQKALTSPGGDDPPDRPIFGGYPLKEIAEIYNTTCKTLPRARLDVWADNSLKNFRARCQWLGKREITAADRVGGIPDAAKDYQQSEKAFLHWWRRFFEHINRSQFLTGQTKDWRADLGWIVKAENFAKIVQGVYHRNAA